MGRELSVALFRPVAGVISILLLSGLPSMAAQAADQDVMPLLRSLIELDVTLDIGSTRDGLSQLAIRTVTEYHLYNLRHAAGSHTVVGDAIAWVRVLPEVWRLQTEECKLRPATGTREGFGVCRSSMAAALRSQSLPADWVDDISMIESTDSALALTIGRARAVLREAISQLSRQ